jgi:hypothetical protein
LLCQILPEVIAEVFGRGLIKIIGLAVGGAIALALGAELLSSVVSVVLAFRFGNSIPLFIVIVVTFGLILIKNNFQEETPSRMILKILSYFATCYLAVVAFVIALPYGLVMSIIIAGAVGVLSSVIGDNKELLSQVTQSIKQHSGPKKHISKSIQIGDTQSYRLNTFHSILLLKPNVIEKVVQLMRERPLLAISLTHYEECDVLFIAEKSDSSKLNVITKLLRDRGIQGRSTASTLLSEAIQLVPVIDSKNGLKFEDYRYTRNNQVIDTLLKQLPTRLTIFPSSRGLGIIVPEIEAPGMEVEHLKQGFEADILLHRNYSSLEEVERQLESTA